MEHEPITARSVQMLAVITKDDDGEIHGELDCEVFEKPFVFSSIISMIEMMETTFDTKGFPEKHMLLRSYGKSKQRLRKHELDLHAVVREKSALAQPKPPGITCSFEILVRFRRSAEWQGHILWLEKDVTKEFSSIVELTRLIDDALSSE